MRNLKQKHNLPMNRRHKTVFFLAKKEAGTTYSYLTGRYSIISSHRKQYIVIFYDYDTNIIQETPTNTCNVEEIRDAKVIMLSTLTTSGHQPYLHILDDEASSSMCQGFLNNNIKYQLVPPHLHRKKCSRT